MGAVLSQFDVNGRERVIVYASRTHSKPERRYCVTRKELLIVVTFICYFRSFLLGQKFTLWTDHGSLTWLSKFKQPKDQLARWIEKLQEYNFDIVHRLGSSPVMQMLFQGSPATNVEEKTITLHKLHLFHQ